MVPLKRQAQSTGWANQASTLRLSPASPLDAAGGTTQRVPDWCIIPSRPRLDKAWLSQHAADWPVPEPAGAAPLLCRARHDVMAGSVPRHRALLGLLGTLGVSWGSFSGSFLGLHVMCFGLFLFGDLAYKYHLFSSFPHPASSLRLIQSQVKKFNQTKYLYILIQTVNMHNSNPSSDAGSVKSGSPSSHSYKKSLSSKADPNTALNADPTLSEIGQASAFSLRSMQHTDRDGRVITDPDLSNPTRNRLERPLDTIRSFEYNIERHRRENV